MSRKLADLLDALRTEAVMNEGKETDGISWAGVAVMDYVQTHGFNDDVTRHQRPAKIEMYALSRLIVAGAATGASIVEHTAPEEYERMLKLRYPDWDGLVTW